jgi:hypothetical protein
MDSVGTRRSATIEAAVSANARGIEGAGAKVVGAGDSFVSFGDGRRFGDSFGRCRIQTRIAWHFVVAHRCLVRAFCRHRPGPRPRGSTVVAAAFFIHRPRAKIVHARDAL